VLDMTFTEVRRSPGIRFAALLIAYTFVLTASQWLAYGLRFDFDIPSDQRALFQTHWSWVIPLKLLVLGLSGQFAGLLSYFSIPDLRRIFYASSISSLSLLLIRYYYPEFYPAPRGVILVDFFFTFASLVAVRLGLRMFRERFMVPDSRPRHEARRVAIIGAGDVGAALARELLTKRGLGLHPVAFFDDDHTKWRSRMHDIPVVGAPERLLDQKLNLELEEAIIAMPSAPAKRIGEIVKLLQRARLKFETVPSMDQLATGQVKVILHGRVVMVTGAGGSIGSELCRQIASFGPQRLLLVDQSEVQAFPIEQELIESGFGEIVYPVVADIRDLVRIRSLFRRFAPAVIFHAAAHKHVPMMENQPSEAIRNNTLGTANLAELALEFGVDRFVLVSTDKAINPTNVMGATKRLAEIFLQSLYASINESSLAPSDAEKAKVRGATESSERWEGTASREASVTSGHLTGRAWEASPASRDISEPQIKSGLKGPLVPRWIAQGVPLAATPTSPLAPSDGERVGPPPSESLRLGEVKGSSKTKFMAVRFGNVLGSSGSVIPIFNKQIAAGGPVKVTHPDVTRYFMTIPEAASLVLQSAAQGSGGEIFVLDMGKPVKIVDLARQLIELSGLKPDEDIEIVFTGLRPGEKLFEELSHKGENITPTQHPKVMRFVCEPLPLKEVRMHLDELCAALDLTEPNQLKLMLKKAVPEYQPYLK
jgi:FlaA1/EpsC-like NDP-sugar epimerase